MSLAGPPNALLEIVLEQLAGQGLVIVAAVGNDGPTGSPLYPAAYDSVVGVTAVDSEHRIYRYANRGRQVMFAAPGVRVGVAAPAGSYAVKSGTSLAAPFVAALIAESIAARQWSAAEALHSLKATAVDLGDPQFDEIFGYGLVGRID
jgi:subtilisin family serine protease